MKKFKLVLPQRTAASSPDNSATPTPAALTVNKKQQHFFNQPGSPRIPIIKDDISRIDSKQSNNQQNNASGNVFPVPIKVNYKPLKKLITNEVMELSKQNQQILQETQVNQAPQRRNALKVKVGQQFYELKNVHYLPIKKKKVNVRIDDQIQVFDNTGGQIKKANFQLPDSIKPPNILSQDNNTFTASDTLDILLMTDDVPQTSRSLIQKYDLDEFFFDDNNDMKLLAEINNEFSTFNTETDQSWKALQKLILSKRNYRTLLVKYRYLVEDITKKNFPFYYEQNSAVNQTLLKWLKHNSSHKHAVPLPIHHVNPTSPKKMVGGFKLQTPLKNYSPSPSTLGLHEFIKQVNGQTTNQLIIPKRKTSISKRGSNMHNNQYGMPRSYSQDAKALKPGKLMERFYRALKKESRVYGPDAQQIQLMKLVEKYLIEYKSLGKTVQDLQERLDQEKKYSEKIKKINERLHTKKVKKIYYLRQQTKNSSVQNSPRLTIQPESNTSSDKKSSLLFFRSVKNNTNMNKTISANKNTFDFSTKSVAIKNQSFNFGHLDNFNQAIRQQRSNTSMANYQSSKQPESPIFKGQGVVNNLELEIREKDDDDDEEIVITKQSFHNKLTTPLKLAEQKKEFILNYNAKVHSMQKASIISQPNKTSVLTNLPKIRKEFQTQYDQIKQRKLSFDHTITSPNQVQDLEEMSFHNLNVTLINDKQLVTPLKVSLPMHQTQANWNKRKIIEDSQKRAMTSLKLQDYNDYYYNDPTPCFSSSAKNPMLTESKEYRIMSGQSTNSSTKVSNYQQQKSGAFQVQSSDQQGQQKLLSKLPGKIISGMKQVSQFMTPSSINKSPINTTASQHISQLPRNLPSLDLKQSQLYAIRLKNNLDLNHERNIFTP